MLRLRLCDQYERWSEGGRCNCASTHALYWSEAAGASNARLRLAIVAVVGPKVAACVKG